MQAGLGASPAFRVPEYQLQSTFELPLVLVLGALCGFVAAAFRVSTQVKSTPLILILTLFLSNMLYKAYQ